MGNLNSRLRKAKSHLEKSLAATVLQFFFRMSPEIMEGPEKCFRKENPDFQGEIIVFTFGTENLKPYIPDGHNERS
jgi:hypothetical protein